MLEPFIWMFRIENFGKYISKILAVFTLFFFVSIIFLIPLLWSGAVLSYSIYAYRVRGARSQNGEGGAL